MTRVACLAALVAVASLVSPPPAQAFEECPVTPVPNSRWGTLEPRSIIHDGSCWTFGSVPNSNDPYFFMVDVENGWLFAAAGKGLSIMDARNNPANPLQTADHGGYHYAPPITPIWFQSDQKFYIWDVDAPPGVDDIVATASSGNGLIAWNTSNKNNPSIHYQDAPAGETTGVVSLTIGGRHYAFTAAGSAAKAYDLTAASALQGCRDQTTSSIVSCTGVYRGAFSSNPVAGIGGVDHFVVVNRINAGIEIWDVANPSSPQLVMTDGERTGGTQMWYDDTLDRYYLATARGSLKIFDVSAIDTPACHQSPCSLPGPVSVTDPGPFLGRLNVSESNGRPMVWVSEASQSSGPQLDFLYDVSTPNAPQEITPQHPDGYWGWYYSGNPSPGGFEWVNSGLGAFNGPYIYRVAFGVYDVHQWVGAIPPTAGFTWSPSEVYPGTNVSFTDTSTGSPTSWSWSFQDGNPSTSSSQNPSVTFDSDGSKQVQLQVCNDEGCDSTTQTVTVLDPAPAVGSVAVSPTNPIVCQPITFSAQGVTGQAPLTLAWDVRNATGSVTTGGNVNPFVWNTGASTPPDNYTTEVTVTNGLGSASAEVNWTLGALPSLSVSTPTNDPFQTNLVQFHVASQGATEWSWNFDDGLGYQCPTEAGEWCSNPSSGPNPIYEFDAIGTYFVTVRARNCVEGPVESLPLQVDITSIEPLVARFQATSIPCFGGVCDATVGVPIFFADQSLGEPTRWDYDWNGDGSFEDLNNTAPVTTHTYTGTGTFAPRVRVWRAAETDEYTHTPPIEVSNISPPSISVNGPSSGETDDTLNFFASASNCSPSSSGWSWSVSGGDIQGTSNTNAIQVSWSTPGSKTVTATNASCPGAQGSKIVSITEGGGGGGGGGDAECGDEGAGGLTACMAFLPEEPEAGEPVSFDGGSSLGAPTDYSWDFGDGSPVAFGATQNHTFATEGEYDVVLRVERFTGAGCAPFGCLANHVRTVTVGGEGEPPPPPPPPPPAEAEVTVLPWLAQSTGALPQSSDLFLHNPDDGTIEVELVFKKRGTPEPDPPTIEMTLQTKETRRWADVLSNLFGIENLSGSVQVTRVSETGLDPVLGSFNRTFPEDGGERSQAVPGLTTNEIGGLSPSDDTIHLVGLNDTAERVSYFGITNPVDAPLTYKVRAYDSSGFLLGEADTLQVARFGQRQFQIEEMRSVLGIEGHEDFRVAIEVIEGGPAYPYGANVRTGTLDPSFVQPGRTDSSRQYLLGVLTKPGLEGSQWEADAVIFNPSDGIMNVTLQFLNVGVVSLPTAPAAFVVGPGATVRLADVLRTTLGVDEGAGVLIVQSAGVDGVFPVVQAETFDNQGDESKYGQFVAARNDAEAAQPGDSQYLVGLEASDAYRTVLWMYNPSNTSGSYNIVYRGMLGQVIGRDDGYVLPAGRTRQIVPNQQPLNGYEGFYSAEIEVVRGTLLSGAQVVNNANNDPAYVKGQTRGSGGGIGIEN